MKSLMMIAVCAALLTAAEKPATVRANPAERVVSAPVSKVVVFVFENHSLAQMKTGMPYMFGLAQQYGFASNYRAIRHPSLPNYLAMVSGSTHGVKDNNPPAVNTLTGQTVFGQALAAGRTAKLYAESMPGRCWLTKSKSYVVKHNPWAYFVDERSACNLYDVPLTQLGTDAANGTLPNVGMVVPNQANNGHNRGLDYADAWFEARMRSVFAGPDWLSGRLAVIVTADEDDRLSGNSVLTAVIHPSQDGRVVTTPLTHYSLTRLLEDVSHSPYLDGAATAPDMVAAFGLPLAG